MEHLKPEPDDRPPLVINVGPLSGLSSLCLNVGKGLHRYTELYRAGGAPQVDWDLRYLTQGKMSLAALASFLAIAERMRNFSGKPLRAHAHHNPRIFAFLDDIQFLKLVRDLDLFAWEPESVVSDYRWFSTNPHTIILAFSQPMDAPDFQEGEAFIRWKDRERQQLTEALLERSGPIFGSLQTRSSGLMEQVVITTAELALNCHIWGRAPAFVALQRSTSGVTVSVCDAGRGFMATLTDQSHRGAIRPKNHRDAILIASLLNHRDYGLRHAITQTVQAGGWVDMSSGNATMRWSAANWSAAVEVMGNEQPFKPEVLTRLVQVLDDRTATPSATRRGFSKVFDFPLRGVRVSFEASTGRRR